MTIFKQIFLFYDSYIGWIHENPEIRLRYNFCDLFLKNDKIVIFSGFGLTMSMFDELTSEFGQRSSQMVQESDFDFFATSELRSLGYSRCLIHNREYTTFMIMFFMNDLEWKMNNEIILCLNDSSPNAATVIPTGWNQAIWLVHSSILWIQVFAPEIFSNLAVE